MTRDVVVKAEIMTAAEVEAFDSRIALITSRREANQLKRKTGRRHDNSEAEKAFVSYLQEQLNP